MFFAKMPPETHASALLGTRATRRRIEVGRIEQEDALRRAPVASGATDLLDVLLQRAGCLVVGARAG
jgi:hypothetical protein